MSAGATRRESFTTDTHAVKSNHTVYAYTSKYLSIHFDDDPRSGRRQSLFAPTMARKIAVPWTKDEHDAFLRGMEHFGRGRWKDVSRHFVPTRTPTQVASHAQKHFMRIEKKMRAQATTATQTTTTTTATATATTDAQPPPLYCIFMVNPYTYWGVSRGLIHCPIPRRHAVMI